MGGNGALESHIRQIQGCDPLPAFTTRDPNPITKACCGSPVTTQYSFGSEFGLNVKESRLISEVGISRGYI